MVVRALLIACALVTGPAAADTRLIPARHPAAARAAFETLLSSPAVTNASALAGRLFAHPQARAAGSFALGLLVRGSRRAARETRVDSPAAPNEVAVAALGAKLWVLLHALCAWLIALLARVRAALAPLLTRAQTALAALLAHAEPIGAAAVSNTARTVAVLISTFTNRLAAFWRWLIFFLTVQRKAVRAALEAYAATCQTLTRAADVAPKNGRAKLSRRASQAVTDAPPQLLEAASALAERLKRMSAPVLLPYAVFVLTTYVLLSIVQTASIQAVVAHARNFFATGWSEPLFGAPVQA